MQRSSHSAGVRPSRNMQYTARSHVICLVITVVTSQANGFTIRRLEPLPPTSDLELGQSSKLEVRYDLQTPKSPITHKIDGDLITLKESTTTTEITTNSFIDLARSSGELPIVNENKHLNEHYHISETSSPSLQTVTNDFTMTSSLLNFTSPTTENAINKQNNESELFTTENELKRFLKYAIQISDNNSHLVTSTEATSPANGSITLKYNEKQENTTENMDNLMSEANTAVGHTFTAVPHDDRVQYSTELLQDTQAPTSSKFNFEISSQPMGEIVLQSTSNNPVPELTTNTYASSDMTQSSTASEESFKVTMIDFTTDTNDGYLVNNLPTTVDVPIVGTLNTQTVKEEPVTLTLPTWESYKTTDRNITSTEKTEENTSSNLNMTRAESTRMSLEKVLTNAPIPSLMELKNDLINVQEYTTRTYINEMNVTIPSNLTTPTIQNTSDRVNLQTEKFDIISSKRAGYLDNTETTSTKFEEATTENYINKSNTKDTDSFGSMYETEGSEGEVSDALEVKNVTGLESQSQLVEDAIKEELLMEKTLNENEYLKEKARQMEVKPVLGITPPVIDATPTLHEVVTEDVLSVKPITIDKKISSALYAVSPNYKPPKKLDILPTKQFVRDPDDNTWRNESISSLGIVFKPKNASKSFTEVLKNKTSELSNMSEKNDKNNIPDLRIRLEKIAEVRKSKKKKINAFGDIVYSDSDENGSSSKEEATSPMSPEQKSDLTSVTSSPPSSSTSDTDVINYIPKENFKMFKDEFATPVTTLKNKLSRLGEFYDSADDYDADYVTRIDLKKFTTSPKTDTDKPSSQDFTLNTKHLIPVTYMPNRQPTIQYFPPTKKVKTTVKPEVKVKVNINEYDDYFKNKVNQFMFTHQPNTEYDASFGTASPAHTNQFQPNKLHSTAPYSNEEIHKNLYLTSQPQVTDIQGGFLNNANLNKASYVIKHYKDFIADAAKGNDDDNLPFTVAPIQGVTISDIDKLSKQKELKRDEDYDYNTQFRKDIVNRFVDNFNQNSDRFKVDFPILYNNSVIHRSTDDNGRGVASSRTFMKRLYDSASPRPNFLSNVKPCDANCESMRVVDLAPAYELHYYVPEQEEKEEIEPRQNVLPYRYRL
ncbi:unnamed protein product [Arctia plantaginis]|uniref:Uncharacterized protein n=1 Tax=Arctia plantaginis TaxID=874455 RepID=A0A8S0YQ10_ARCPL|nr:unnamed protein product [Arctia plantaginis]